MAKLSVNFKSIQKVLEMLSRLESEEGVNLFVTDEQREEILSAANARIKELSALPPALSPKLSASKQGELSGDITQKTDDFKDGVQGIKSVDSPDSTTSSVNPGQSPRSYVTCEDVIAKMRNAGKKI